MANISSLKPFKKGNDPRRNLKGRPENSKSAHMRFKELLFEALKRKLFKDRGRTFEEILVEQGIYQALKRKFSFYKLIMDYRFGKPRMAESPEPEQPPADDDDLPESIFRDPEVNALRQKYITELGNLLYKKGYFKK